MKIAPTLQQRVEKSFATAVRRGLQPLVADTDTVPRRLHVPKPVVDAFKDQTPGLMDGHLSLYKMPFGTNNSVYVVSYAGGDDSNEDIFFSKSGKKIDDHSFGT